ncbi:MAG: hypothetical protein Q4G42_03630 [Neisseria sp.]|nr:hypothetical protein [Neisseria sp.]
MFIASFFVVVIFFAMIVGMIKPSIFSFGSFKATRLKIIGIWFFLTVIASIFMGNAEKTTNQLAGGQAGNTQPTATSAPLTSDGNANIAKSEASKWQYSEKRDEMRGSTTYWATLKSNNKVAFDFPYNGGSYLTLELRKDPQYGNDVMFSISKGQFTCVMGCKGSVKFDDGQVQSVNLTGASDGSADVVFIQGSKSIVNFVDKIKKSKTMMVEFEFYNEGRNQFKFDTANLEWKHF